MTTLDIGFVAFLEYTTARDRLADTVLERERLLLRDIVLPLLRGGASIDNGNPESDLKYACDSFLNNLVFLRNI